MTQTVTRLFDTPHAALEAVRALERAGVDLNAVSLVANNEDGWANELRAGEEGPKMQSNLADEKKGDAGHGVETGMTAGGILGGWFGALAGLGGLAIPGVGAAVGAGWLLSAAIGALGGAALGGAAGGLLGALKEEGVSHDDAEVYVEGVRRGGAVLSVRADDPDHVARLLESHGGVHATARRQAYQNNGWTSFDEAALADREPEMAQDRARPEPKSFAGGASAEAEDELIHGAPASPPAQPGRDV